MENQEPDECLVCSIKSVKTGMHYGAITCYPCRSFFRRSQERKRALRCKFDSQCVVDFSVKIHCPLCRFQKCMRMGMKPEQVLSEEARKERFAVSICRKEGTRNISNNATTSSIASVPNTTTSISSPEPSKTTSSISISLPSPLGLRTLNELFVLPDQDEERGTELIERLHGEESDLVNKDEQISLTTQCEVDIAIDKKVDQNPLCDVVNAFTEEIFVINSEIVDESVDFEDLVQNMPVSLIVDSKFDKDKSVTVSLNIVEGADLEYSEDEVILKYIHKKFRKLDFIKKRNKYLELFENSETNQNAENRKRKTVIVQHCSKKRGLDDLKLDINFTQIQTLCSKYFSQEESIYLDMINEQFEESRKRINFGEVIVSDFIRFCEFKVFAPAFFKAVSKQYRERYMNFIFSLDLIENLSSEIMFTLLKENLGKAEMMSYIFVFNAANSIEELNFVWGQNDIVQWNARDPNILGLPFVQGMNYLPLPEMMKYEIFKELMPCCNPVFRDRTVLIILLLISVFNQDQNQKIRKIKENLLGLLERYLENSNSCNVRAGMQDILKCIESLPRLLKIFTDMAELQQ